MPKERKRITIALEVKLHKRLVAVAKHMKQSHTKIVTKLIDDYIDQVEQSNKEMADYLCPVPYTSEFFQEIQFFGIEDTLSSPPDSNQLNCKHIKN